MPQPAKAQRARAPAQLMGRARIQCERGAAVCTDQLPVGVRAAELNYVLRMRLEANDPQELGSVDHCTYLLLWRLDGGRFQPKISVLLVAGWAPPFWEVPKLKKLTCLSQVAYFWELCPS